jgi:hypothetical protein
MSTENSWIILGRDIHKELKKLGGISNLDLKEWSLSDDTVREIPLEIAYRYH